MHLDTNQTLKDAISDLRLATRIRRSFWKAPAAQASYPWALIVLLGRQPMILSSQLSTGRQGE